MVAVWNSGKSVRLKYNNRLKKRRLQLAVQDNCTVECTRRKLNADWLRATLVRSRSRSRAAVRSFAVVRLCTPQECARAHTPMHLSVGAVVSPALIGTRTHSRRPDRRTEPRCDATRPVRGSRKNRLRLRLLAQLPDRPATASRVRECVCARELWSNILERMPVVIPAMRMCMHARSYARVWRPRCN